LFNIAFEKTMYLSKLRVVYAVLHLIALWFTKHTARHTNATLLLSLEVPIETVSKILGHADIKTTQIYAKIIDKSKRDAVDKLDGLTR
jgi:site-specific recombinase XerD